jgi:uncharacterized phage protein gp47/JayE
MTDAASQIDYTSKDYASLRETLLQLATDKLPEWTDHSPNDLGVLLLELFAYMGDALFYHQDRIAAESFLETAIERRSVVQLLRLIGYELRPPLAASADLTLVFAGNATGPVTIPKGAAFTTTAAATGAPITFQFIQRPLTIDRTSLPTGIIDSKGNLAPPPSPLPAGSKVFKLYRRLPVVQVDMTVTGEILASSDGTAGQRYPLARSPVIDDTLEVRVDEGAGPELWTRVQSLFDSGSADTHYAVRRDENGVVFIELGDGTYGKVPRRGLNNITATYCVGGGIKGNVNAPTITKIVTSIPDLKQVLNEKAAGGGTDAEATADAVKRGPRQFRAMGRAVTASDFEALAKAFGVGKARAEAASWNNVEIVVAPTGGGHVSETLKEDLLAFLDARRIMTTIVQIKDPTYAQVLIDATVTVQSQFSRRLVQQEVEDVVKNLLAFENVEFGQALYISRFYDAIQDIDGVLAVNITKFARLDPADQASSPDLTNGGLPKDGQLTFFDLGELPTWAGFDGTGSTLTMQGGVTNA